MKIKLLPAAIFVVVLFSVCSFSQGIFLINAPGSEPAKAELSSEEQKLMNDRVLPKVRKKLASDICEEAIDVAAVIHGSFTRQASDQTLVFYQFCQTGNGLGSVGVAIFDSGKVVGNYVSAESGWTQEAKALPDVNENGVDEFALFYSGGMHQGEGGTGVDIMEVSGGNLKGIGWFQADSFTETTNSAYKVTVKAAQSPLYFRERWTTNASGKWRKVGTATPLKLKPAFGSFEAVK